jgi:Holliday junction DNA helicase RuvA
MIGQLNGILLEKNPPQILVECAGVGYEVDVPMSTFYQLPQTGETVRLLIHFVVREDAQILFGFLTHQEKSAFKQLVKISGVGPRTALGVLSGMSVDELSQAIKSQDPARLTKIPGIGKKTAERLLLELKGKVQDAIAAEGLGGALPPQTPANQKQSDIESALIALGYSERDASLALKALPDDIGVAEGIKVALRAISK